MGPERHEGAVGPAGRGARQRLAATPSPYAAPSSASLRRSGPWHRARALRGRSRAGGLGTNLSLQGWGPRPGSRRFRPVPSLTAALSLQELAGTPRPGSSPKRG